MSMYDEMQGVVRDVLGDPDLSQGAVYYVKLTPGNGPIDDPGPSSTALYKIDSAVQGVSTKYVSMGMAVATDLQVTASVSGAYVPDQRDKVQVDGVMHKIVQIIKLPAAGTTVAFRFIIRRGE